MDFPNPVIVIPGVLGSRLVSENDAGSVWGEWHATYSDPATDEGRRLFGLPMAMDTPLDRLTGASRADSTLGRVRSSVAGVPVTVTAYGDVMSALGVESYADTFLADRSQALSTGQTAFEFSYDWRRSLDESAIELEAFMQRAIRFLQVQRNSAAPIRFDVVAHSMGGLVLRYFLEYGGQLLPRDGDGPRRNWAGAGYVDKAIILGTPNAGSLKMIERILRGIPGNPVHPTYGPVLIGTFPSGYQLLPRGRHRPCFGGEADPLDPDFWLSRDWGLAASWLDEERAAQLPGVASGAERLAIAEDHLRKCLDNARRFQVAMDSAVDDVPGNLEFHLFAGEGQKTPVQFSAEPGARRLRWSRYEPGDGTVLASSARLTEPDGRSPIPWTSVTVVRSSHMALLRDRELLTRVLSLLDRARSDAA